jgi:hypothetical protein
MARCCELLYALPYPLDLNPIEGTLVEGPRQGVARDPEFHVEAMAVTLDAINARDSRGFPGIVAGVYLVRPPRQGPWGYPSGGRGTWHAMLARDAPSPLEKCATRLLQKAAVRIIITSEMAGFAMTCER